MPTPSASSSQCVVCKEKPSLYKCPKCLIKYCSLACYKSHQAALCVKSGPVDEAASGSPAVPISQSGHGSGVEPDRGCVGADLQQQRSQDLAPPCLTAVPLQSGGDTVPGEVLQRLGECPALKEMLRNDHLVTLIRALDSSGHPELDMSRAMREPIFTEFAAQCLNIIEPRKD